MPRTESPPALRRIIAAHALSRAGDYLYNIALIVHIFSVTGSLSWVAVVSVARLIPAVLLAPVAGALADRYQRRTVIVVSQVLGAAVMLGLVAQVALDVPMAWIAVSAMLAVAVTSPGGPALTALLAEVVPPADRASANSLVGIVENGAVIVGPAAGALALLLGPGWISFALNALTFVIAAAIVAGIRTGRSSLPHDETDGRRALLDGAQSALRPEVRHIVGWTALTYLLFGVQVVLVAPVSRDLLATGSWGVGCLEAAAGVGGVVAAAWLKRRPQSASNGSALPLALLLNAAGLAGIVVLQLPILAWTAIAMAGIGAAVVDVAGTTQLMAAVPGALIGRVDAWVRLVAVGAVIAGNVIGAVVIESAGVVGGTLWCALPVALLAAARLGQLRPGFGSERRPPRGAQPTVHYPVRVTSTEDVNG